MIRLFIAVDPPAPVQEELWQSFAPWHREWSSVRWEKPGKLHITIKFLGSTEASRIQRIQEALSNSLTPRAGFDARLSHAGAFPSMERPRVVWVGLDRGVDPLRDIHSSIDEAMMRIGFPKEKRRFSAHITLGRIRRDGGALPLNRIVVPKTSFPVREIRLKDSMLTPRGSIYRDVAVFPLCGYTGRSAL